MSLLFNMLSRFVVAFLQGRKYLLISWLLSQSSVILEPKKIKSVTASTFSLSICHEVMGLDNNSANFTAEKIKLRKQVDKRRMTLGSAEPGSNLRVFLKSSAFSSRAWPPHPVARFHPRLGRKPGRSSCPSFPTVTPALLSVSQNDILVSSTHL